jgi:anaerobic magnesium-protoporphyrin IX monomethyl ester cyclase
VKICICTTPIRPTPTTFPPFGSLAVIQSLRKIGEQAAFYNIDYFRYSPAQIEAHFRESQFDLVGISSVVSTAYAYTKRLTALIRRVSPRTIIVVGGNLAASAEILLRKCDVDFCVVGDGELVIRELVLALKDTPKDTARLKQVKGICFLDEAADFHFTGYGQKLASDEIEDPDYGILERDGSISHFIFPIVDNQLVGVDKSVGRGGKSATINVTKGCVARCTFCHRWEKGFRTRPVDRVINHVKMLKEKHGVGFIDVCDENFGSDAKMTHELVERLGELDIPWRCAGVRAHTVTREVLLHWKRNGCTTVNYGVESGSQRMLDIMEKKTSVEDNINALKWTAEAGLNTIVQLVIGMPGESNQTIRETIEFLKIVSSSLLISLQKAPSNFVSINYAQALPGTPLYEWARQHGYIGVEIDDEEKYLLKVSDIDAYAEDHFINYTGLPMLQALMWRPWITAEMDLFQFPDRESTRLTLGEVGLYYFNFLRERVVRRYGSRKGIGWLVRAIFSAGNGSDASAAKTYDYVKDSGYFNVQTGLKFAPLLLNPITRRHFFSLLAVAVALRKGKGVSGKLGMLREYFVWTLRGGENLPTPTVPSVSLRKIINIVPSGQRSALNDPMRPLREGR